MSFTVPHLLGIGYLFMQTRANNAKHGIDKFTDIRPHQRASRLQLIVWSFAPLQSIVRILVQEKRIRTPLRIPIRILEEVRSSIISSCIPVFCSAIIHPGIIHIKDMINVVVFQLILHRIASHSITSRPGPKREIPIVILRDFNVLLDNRIRSPASSNIIVCLKRLRPHHRTLISQFRHNSSPVPQRSSAKIPNRVWILL